MPDIQAPSQLTAIDAALLHTLVYFEHFTYPLSAREIQSYCQHPGAYPAAVEAGLQRLMEQGLVFHFDGYFQTVDAPQWLTQRQDYNQRADTFLPVARKMARFIGAFPFVRGVMVSGSLSKHCMRPDSDIDFFIITSPGRLWLARTLLVLFKKIFLFNSHKYFCVNYFIDTEHLQIEEQNLFTATEIVTLLPLYGPPYYQEFVAANPWAWRMLPHFPQREAPTMPSARWPFLKRLGEYLFGGAVGQWLDQRAMHLTVNYWRRKFHHFETAKFEIALKSRQYVSKHHPEYFQQQVLHRIEKRWQEITSPEKRNRS